MLNLSSNKILQISPFLGYYHLEHLNLGTFLNSVEFNQIKYIENLSVLSKLKELNLSYNQIGSIENVSSLKELKSLKLSKNKIKTIENLESLENLEVLKLDYN